MSGASLDALPYYDKQVEDPAIKARAKALIDAELKDIPRPAEDDPRLPSDIEVFPKNQALASLLANYADEPIRGIDASKYAPPTVPETGSAEEYAAAAKRGLVGEGHMSLRNENVNVIQTYGPNAWLVRNYQLNAELKELQAAHEQLKEDITEVNRSRRVAQEEAGEHLGRLENRWGDLVSSTVQLDMACMAMEGEVRGLRDREAKLRQEVAELEGQ